MQRLYQITVPGVSVARDCSAIRHRLLNDFPDVVEVLATTIPATVLIVYRGEDRIDPWLDAVGEALDLPALPSRSPSSLTTRGSRACSHMPYMSPQPYVL